MASTRSRSVVAAIAAALAVSALGGGVAWATHPAYRPMGAGPRAVTLPQTRAARRGAAWLATQVNSHGYVVSSGTPDLSDTTLTVLALAAAGTDHSVAERALGYLEGHVNAYVKVDGSDDAGGLATLILDAHALGVKPTSFGGTNLVTRLLATERASGPDKGLFGAQDPTYDGAFRQGLALAALAAAGVTKKSEVGAAVSWLEAQQCTNGGWEAYRTSTTTRCVPSDPSTYTGPDTNSTALAVEGLVAQHAATVHSAASFFASLQASSGGWGYYGGAADPDSTGLVIQALVALHDSVSATRFHKGSKDPVTALLGFQLKSGAFYYPGSPTANGLSTEQAVPALAKKAFPF